MARGRLEERDWQFDNGKAQGRKCANMTQCPGQTIDSAAGRRTMRSEQVRQVAEEVARVCTGMDDPSLAECFSGLFDLPSDSKLFVEFCAAYRSNDNPRPNRRGEILGRVRSLAALLEGAGR